MTIETVAQGIGTLALGSLTGLGLAFLFDMLGLYDVLVDVTVGLMVILFLVACLAGWHYCREYRGKFSWRREQARRRKAALR